MQPKLELPQQKALWQQIHEVLEKLIIHRTFRPGAHLREQDLSEQFGVSRGPIREALRTLQTDGWVVVRHNHGAFVRTPKQKEVVDVFEVREVLEAQAAALAAERITDSQLEDMEKLIEQGYEATAAQDVGAFVDLNTQFHRQVAIAAGNGVLRSMLEQIEKRVVWYLAAVMAYRGQNSWNEHQLLLEALQARNAMEASRIMIEHTRATLATYLDEIKEENDHTT